MQSLEKLWLLHVDLEMFQFVFRCPKTACLTQEKLLLYVGDMDKNKWKANVMLLRGETG